MIATQGAAGPRIGIFELPVAVAGLLLLLLYVVQRLRGRDLLPRGPAPVAAFDLPDALAVVLAAVALPLLAGGVAGVLGVRSGITLLVLGYAATVLVAGAAWRIHLFRRGEHGPRAAGAAAGLLSWLGLFPVVAGVLVAWNVLLLSLGVEWREQDVLTRLRGDLPLFLLVAVVLAPLAEEVIFRGILYPGLKRRLGVRPALLLSAAAFATVHLSVHVAPAILVLGVALAYVYERTGTLAAPVAFHAMFNGWTFLGEVVKKALGDG